MGRLAAILILACAQVLSGTGVACSGSGSGDTTPTGAGAGGSSGAVGIDSPGVAIAHEFDRLVKEAYDLRCKVCACGGFSPSSPAGEACTGAVFDLYPDAKRQAVCKTDDLRAYSACLEDVIDCGAADDCNAAKQSADARCPAFDEGDATQALPPACTGVM